MYLEETHGEEGAGNSVPCRGLGQRPQAVHLKGENSMQYTAAMKQMPMQGLFSFFLFRRHF